MGPVLSMFHFQSGDSNPNRGGVCCFAQNNFTKPEQSFLEKVKESPIQKKVGSDDEYGCKRFCPHDQVVGEE